MYKYLVNRLVSIFRKISYNRKVIQLICKKQPLTYLKISLIRYKNWHKNDKRQFQMRILIKNRNETAYFCVKQVIV